MTLDYAPLPSACPGMRSHNSLYSSFFWSTDRCRRIWSLSCAVFSLAINCVDW